MEYILFYNACFNRRDSAKVPQNIYYSRLSLQITEYLNHLVQTMVLNNTTQREGLFTETWQRGKRRKQQLLLSLAYTQTLILCFNRIFLKLTLCHIVYFLKIRLKHKFNFFVWHSFGPFIIIVYIFKKWAELNK